MRHHRTARTGHRHKKHRHRAKDTQPKEFEQLKLLVPTLCKQTDVSKVTVIEETIRYIDDLHQRLLQSMHNKGGSNVTIQDLVTAAHRLFLEKEHATVQCAPSSAVNTRATSEHVTTTTND